MPILSATLMTSIKSWRDEQYSSVSSSSQFFMNSPMTFQPCALSSSAATDESTPPDKPTTTVFPLLLLIDIRTLSCQPLLQRHHRRRLTIVKIPAIHHIALLLVRQALRILDLR